MDPLQSEKEQARGMFPLRGARVVAMVSFTIAFFVIGILILVVTSQEDVPESVNGEGDSRVLVEPEWIRDKVEEIVQTGSLENCDDLNRPRDVVKCRAYIWADRGEGIELCNDLSTDDLDTPFLFFGERGGAVEINDQYEYCAVKMATRSRSKEFCLGIEDAHLQEVCEISIEYLQRREG